MKMVSDEVHARDALVDVARRLDASGLNVNSSGNLSVRVADGIVVTPSGITPDAMLPRDCVLLALDGTPARDGEPIPTSEWRLHVELYHRNDVGAVVHTHSLEATAASTLAAGVPAVHYAVAKFGAAELPCAPYATYGTSDLAVNVANTLGERGTACLMANHGAVAVGADLDAALALALDIEWLCGVHRRAIATGVPRVLGADEIDRVADRFRSYGQVAATDHRDR